MTMIKIMMTVRRTEKMNYDDGEGVFPTKRVNFIEENLCHNTRKINDLPLKKQNIYQTHNLVSDLWLFLKIRFKSRSNNFPFSIISDYFNLI